MRKMQKLGIVMLALFTSSAFANKKVAMTPGDLLSRIHSANQEEISAGELAKQKATSSQVKQYAAQLVKDHTKAEKLVTDLAKEKKVTLTTTPMPKTAKEGGKMVKHIATTAELKTMAAGHDFDRAYLEAMEDGHGDVITTLETADTSDRDVQKLAAKLLPELKAHKRMASRLLKTVVNK